MHYAELTSGVMPEESAAIRQRVNAARERQRQRFADTTIRHNAAMGVRELQQYGQLDAAGERLLAQAMQHYGLSARAHGRIRKVARTIADLAGDVDITATHLSEAIQYRTLDRNKRGDFCYTLHRTIRALSLSQAFGSTTWQAQR